MKFYVNFSHRKTNHAHAGGRKQKTETFQYISYIISVSVEVLSNELHLRIQKTFSEKQTYKNRYFERCDQL